MMNGGFVEVTSDNSSISVLSGLTLNKELNFDFHAISVIGGGTSDFSNSMVISGGAAFEGGGSESGTVQIGSASSNGGTTGDVDVQASSLSFRTGSGKLAGDVFLHTGQAREAGGIFLKSGSGFGSGSGTISMNGATITMQSGLSILNDMPVKENIEGLFQTLSSSLVLSTHDSIEASGDSSMVTGMSTFNSGTISVVGSEVDINTASSLPPLMTVEVALDDDSILGVENMGAKQLNQQRQKR
jgi:hypothetical protein